MTRDCPLCAQACDSRRALRAHLHSWHERPELVDACLELADAERRSREDEPTPAAPR